MIKWLKPGPEPKAGEAHLKDEVAMRAIEKEMLNNIHREIYGKWYFIKKAPGKYAIAASLALLFCSVLLVLKFSAQSKVTWYSIAAEKGHINIISLPDGSTVWLNSGSTIRYPEKFGKTRDIELVNGEAYFDIKHDDNSPFIVHYGKLHARVLGTAFNIKYYKKVSDVRVTVTRGRVEVGKGASSFGVLAHDNEIAYDLRSEHYVMQQVDAGKVAAWRTNEINLYDISFAELMLRLENIYNVHITYDHKKMDALATTIHFSNKDNLEQVLKIIKTIHKVSYSINGKEVLLEKVHTR